VTGRLPPATGRHPAQVTPRAVPECHAEVCITCSDQAVQVRVVELSAGRLATVDTGTGLAEVSVALVEAGVGDVVLVHAGEAIAVVRDR
jgi:hydrogenase expression/formation protein HypC